MGCEMRKNEARFLHFPFLLLLLLPPSLVFLLTTFPLSSLQLNFLGGKREKGEDDPTTTFYRECEEESTNAFSSLSSSLSLPPPFSSLPLGSSFSPLNPIHIDQCKVLSLHSPSSSTFPHSLFFLFPLCSCSF